MGGTALGSSRISAQDRQGVLGVLAHLAYRTGYLRAVSDGSTRPAWGESLCCRLGRRRQHDARASSDTCDNVVKVSIQVSRALRLLLPQDICVEKQNQSGGQDNTVKVSDVRSN